MHKVSFPIWGKKIGNNHNRGGNVLFCSFVWGFCLFLLTYKHDLVLILCLEVSFFVCFVAWSLHMREENKKILSSFLCTLLLSPFFIATTASLHSWSLYMAWAQESFEQWECFNVQTASSPGIIYKDCIRNKLGEFGELPWDVLMAVTPTLTEGGTGHFSYIVLPPLA